jgi:hypothetical protein
MKDKGHEGGLGEMHQGHKGKRARAFFHCVLCLLCVPYLHSETIDRVLAVVGGQVITLTDVTAARELGLQSATGADPVRDILSKLIDRELMLAEVDRYGPPEPARDVVDRELAAIRGRFANDRAYEAALARSGIDEQHLRETIRQDLRTRAYLDQRFAPDARRQTLIDEWLASLRRRGDIIDLYAGP